MNSSFFSVTGIPGSGKTAFLTSLVQKSAQRGIEAGGFVQKRVVDQAGITIAYDLLRVRTGEQMRVATRNEHGGFAFDAEAFRAALDWVKQDFKVAKLIVVDELGIIEIQGRGHAAVLPILMEA